MQGDDDLPPQLVQEIIIVNDEDLPKIPITLLTGFLGAGKSTLLEYILTANHGYKIAVCMNDFGDTTDIEASSMTLSSSASDKTTEFLSLPNGCLCCSIKEPGIAAIEDLVARKGEEGSALDWVVVELTGVADPAEIAKSFWTNEELGGRLRLDSVVCVVDSRNVEKQIEAIVDGQRGNECQRQIACSDVILLNKTDLVTSSDLAQVRKIVQHINPAAPLIPTLRSAVPLDDIFSIGAFSGQGKDGKLLVSAINDADQEEHSHGHIHAPHVGDIEAVTLRIPVLSDEMYDKLEKWLQRVLWDGLISSAIDDDGTAAEILRSKGILCREDGRRVVLQGVRDLFELKELDGGVDGQVETVGKIVLIGKAMGAVDVVQKALDGWLGGEH